MTSISNKKDGSKIHPDVSSSSGLSHSPKIDFSRWDQRYSQEAWSEIPDPELVNLAEDLEPGRALDLGCGTGRNSLWLAKKGWLVTGIDSSYVGLSQAMTRARSLKLNIELIHHDLAEYDPPTRQFDLVVVSNLHFAEPMRTRLFEIAKSALQTGGYIYFLGRHKDSIGHKGPSDPRVLFSATELRDKLIEFEIVSIFKAERNSKSGRPPSTNVIGWAKRKD